MGCDYEISYSSPGTTTRTTAEYSYNRANQQHVRNVNHTTDTRSTVRVSIFERAELHTKEPAISKSLMCWRAGERHRRRTPSGIVKLMKQWSKMAEQNGGAKWRSKRNILPFGEESSGWARESTGSTKCFEHPNPGSMTAWVTRSRFQNYAK